MLTIRGVYYGKSFRVLPSEPLPVVNQDVPVAIIFLEEVSVKEQKGNQQGIAKRMRAARDSMEPLGLSVKDLVEEGRER